jgi:Tol biopolymer transport system component
LLHFTSQADSQTLHIYDIEKKQETLALPNAQFSRPAWLPDSQALVYMQNDSTMVFISAEGQELDRVQFSNGEQIYGYSFSPDGAQMVVSAYQNNEYGIYIADLAVSSAGRLDAPDAAGLLSKRIYSILSTTEIHWSPMGEQIAFIAQENEKYEIFVINPDGTGLFNVTNSPQTVVTTLSWSPDGAKLAFTSDRMTPYQMDTYVIRVDGSELTRLSDSATGTAFTPSWTPDGARIMYSTFLDNNSAGSLFLVNPDGTQRQRIPTELLGVYALNGVFRP